MIPDELVLRQVLCRLEIWRVAFLKTTFGMGAHAVMSDEKRFKNIATFAARVVVR